RGVEGRDGNRLSRPCRGGRGADGCLESVVWRGIEENGDGGGELGPGHGQRAGGGGSGPRPPTESGRVPARRAGRGGLGAEGEMGVALQEGDAHEGIGYLVGVTVVDRLVIRLR